MPDDSHIFNNKQDFDIFKHKELYTGKVQNGAYRNGDIDSPTIEKYRPLYFEMLERISLKRNALSTAVKEKFFFDNFIFWKNYFLEKEVDLVFSPIIPHRGYDFSIYLACKSLNIKFISIQMTPFLDNFLVIDDIFQCTNENLIASNNKNSEKITKEIQKYIKKNTDKYAEAMPYYMIQQENEKRLINKIPFFLKKISSFLYYLLTSSFKGIYITKDKTKGYKDSSLIDFLISRIAGIRRLNFLRAEYKRHIVKIPIDKKIIFFPMHYSPEETSNPTGGERYFDQEKIIRDISNNIPEDYVLVVKEHTTQFHYQYYGYLGRDLDFYRKISSFKNVFFIDSQLSSFEIIDNSDAIVTISGTAGFEALCRKTKCLLFGRSWYESLPGVYKIKSSTDISAALQDKFIFNEGNLMRATNNLIQKSFYGSYDQHYENRSDSTREETLNQLNLIFNQVYKEIDENT